jgi:hypothetical protein
VHTAYCRRATECVATSQRTGCTLSQCVVREAHLQRTRADRHTYRDQTADFVAPGR